MRTDTSKLVVHPDTQAALDSFCAKPAHAVLLLGNPGTGKRTLAKALAKELLVLDQAANIDTQAFVYIVTPSQGTIPIAAIRDIRAFLKLRVPSHSDTPFNRAIIIEEAQLMTREAQNALLKLLEEPPEHTLIIITATQAERVLPTVRSRLQKIRVRQPSMQEIVAFFVAQGVAHEAIERALMIHDGNIAAASQEVFATDEQPASHLNLVKQALQATTFERLAMVDGLSKQKPEATAFVQALLVAASASMRKAALVPDADKLLRWEKVVEAARTAERALARNANTKIVLTELMLTL